jgi:hypothetical protein
MLPPVALNTRRFTMADFIIPLYAFLGGIAVNFISLTELKNISKSQRPETFSDLIYCLWFFGVPLVGGFLAFAYQNSSVSLSPILSINIGASAPLILKSLAAAVPQFGKPKIG